MFDVVRSDKLSSVDNESLNERNWESIEQIRNGLANDSRSIQKISTITSSQQNSKKNRLDIDIDYAIRLLKKEDQNINV